MALPKFARNQSKKCGRSQSSGGISAQGHEMATQWPPAPYQYRRGAQRKPAAAGLVIGKF